jgi:antibiotic biosynthesis monooxygenase (ABM) superfamily enzyme
MDAPASKSELPDPEAEIITQTIDPDRERRWAAWRDENAEAIAAANAWYEENGHPLAKYMILPGGAV